MPSRQPSSVRLTRTARCPPPSFLPSSHCAGNDFLPHIPSLDYYDRPLSALEQLMNKYKVGLGCACCSDLWWVTGRAVAGMVMVVRHVLRCVVAAVVVVSCERLEG